MQVDIKNLNSPKAQAAPKSRKPIAMNQPPRLQTYNASNVFDNSEPPKGYFYGILPDELKDNVKNMAIRGLALPAKQRASILQSKLSKSDYVNKYLNRYMILDNLAVMNDHVKFGLVYGFNLFETMMMDLSNLQAPQSKPQHQTKQPEPPNEQQIMNSLNPSD